MAVDANVPEEVDFRVADCCSPDQYRDLHDGADLVYHCASAAYDGLSVFSPAFVHRHTCQSRRVSASFSGGANGGGAECVEVAALPDGRIAVRNIKRPGEAVVLFTRAEMAAWIKGVRNGEFDDLT